MREKSVLLISNLTGRMGLGQSVCESLSQLLSQRGWDMFVASPYKNRIIRFLDMLWVTWKNRNNYSIGYIEVYSGWGFIWAEIISMVLSIMEKPFVLALYGGNLPVFSKENPNRVKKLLKRANVVISPSSYTKELMFSYREDIRILSYGVDFSDFQFRLRFKPLKNLITMRAFHEIYNLSLAPKVLSALSKQFPDLELVMTGGNKHDGNWELVQKTALEEGVADRVQMVGFVPRDELPQLLDRADILLNTPNIDNTPVSLLEAMACGLCIVSTNVGGIPYLMENEKDALLVPANDERAMSSAVHRILTEPELAERLSYSARRKAEQYDWSVVLPQWEALFEELIKHG